MLALTSYACGIGHAVSGPFDEARFRRSAYEVVKAHAVFRSRFEIDAGQVYVRVVDTPDFHLDVRRTHDRSLVPFSAWVSTLVARTFDMLGAECLVRFCVADYGSSWRCHIVTHPAISDGVTFDTALRQLFELYAHGGALDMQPAFYEAPAAPPTTQSEAQEIARIVADLPAAVGLMHDGAAAKGNASDWFIKSTLEQKSVAVRNLADQIGTTPFGILLATYALGLPGFCGETAVSCAFQSAGRKSLGVPDGAAGGFSTTLPLNVSVLPGERFSDFAVRLRNAAGEIRALENTDLLERVFAARKFPRFGINMSPVQMPEKIGDLEIGPQEYTNRYTEFDLNLVLLDTRTDLISHLFFEPRRITPERARLFSDLQARILEAALAAPNEPCEEIMRSARASSPAALPIMQPYPAPETRIHDAFFALAEASPDQPAILSAGTTISYGSLAAQAMDVTKALKEAGATPHDTIAIMAQRDNATIAGVLGVSAFGAPFTMVDADYPVGRVEEMLNRLDVDYVLEAGDVMSASVSRPVIRIQMQPTDSGIAPARQHGTARASAYHLFTSGTTGRPKLCTHPDAPLQRFIGWQVDTLGLTAPIRTLMMSGLAHDPTLRDIFLPLSTGGSVVIPAPESMTDPAALRGLLRTGGCTVLRLSASLSKLLCYGQAPDDVFESIRGIFWGGETVSPETVNIWHRSASNARQFNVFGTTETPQAFCVHEIAQSDVQSDHPIAIGQPLPWTGVRINGPNGAALGVGEIGEIVAELSDKVVGVNPGTASAQGALSSHATGDLGYRLANGDFFFAGRKDRQVNLNGYRIELGEIEAVALRVDGAERAVVQVQGDVLTLSVEHGTSDVSEQDIKSELHRNLPTYMVPKQIDLMAQFPISANGKIDLAKLARQAKAQREAKRPEAGTAPLTLEETQVIELVARHAFGGTPRRDDTVADLGFDSLKTVEVGMALEQIGFRLPNDWTLMAMSDLAMRFQSPQGGGGDTPLIQRLNPFERARGIPIRQSAGRWLRRLPGASRLLGLQSETRRALQLSEMLSSTPSNNRAQRNLRDAVSAMEPGEIQGLYAELARISDSATRVRLERIAPFWHTLQGDWTPMFRTVETSPHCKIFLSQRPTDASLVCFPGAGGNLFLLFSHILMTLGRSDVPPLNLVILTPEYPGSYGRGIPELGTTLAASVNSLKATLEDHGSRNRAYIGASIGGFFALRAGLLDGDAAAVSLGGRFIGLRSVARLSRIGSAFDPLLCEAVTARSRLHCIYSEGAKHDRASAELLKNARPSVALYPVIGSRSHNPIAHIQSESARATLIRQFAELAHDPQAAFTPF